MEFYGFFIYVASIVLYATYLLWMLVPDVLLHRLGIFYYPAKHWAIVVPNFAVVLLVYAYAMVFGIQLMRLPSRNSLSYVVDGYSQLDTVESTTAMKPLRDVPLCQLPRNRKYLNPNY